jgi:RNA recognition motif-containing protein
LEDKKKLYVGNLPYTVTSDELKKLFSEFGEVVDAVVITDKYSGRSKGFGFVTFGAEDMADKAIKGIAEKELEGRKLVVNVARPPKERTN